MSDRGVSSFVDDKRRYLTMPGLTYDPVSLAQDLPSSTLVVAGV